ncbi:MAG: dihydrodipicolinate synthase family protein [Chloroflexi bacterium]|nr:dihydrodipicolinate synthase family protein [Chloroflexota bacterium]
MHDLASFKGVFPPIVTPLTSEEEVDQASLRRLTAWLIEHGVHGIWAMGSSGEFPALDATQRARAVEAVVEAAEGRVPVIATISDVGTELAVRHGRAALAAGADAVAATPPYYFPVAQDELLAHYRRIREAIDLPLLIYNFPQMVKVKVELSTALRLAEEGTVVGIKDSQNDLDWFRRLVLATRARGLDFRGFVGTRTLMDASIAVGAAGVIPNVSNIAPRWCVRCYEAAAAGDFAEARRCQEKALEYEHLSQVASGGSPTGANFSTVKHVLRVWGIISSTAVSRPLRPLTPEEVARLEERLKTLPSEAEVRP